MDSFENLTRGRVGRITVVAALLCTVVARGEPDQLRKPRGRTGAVEMASHAALAKKLPELYNDKSKTAGLSRQGLALTDAPAHAEIWEKVLRK